MREHTWLAERFEENRPHMRSVAYRMLGSLSEADDAVQESWLRLSRTDTSRIHNLGGWLTTVVARVCLEMLRSRKSRREEPFDARQPEPAAGSMDARDLEEEALMADSVGLALLVVLETLGPVERVAFVLHDVFAVPFDEIAPIVGRSPAATRQIASRARRRVRGTDTVSDRNLTGQREVVEAFLAAARSGDLGALLAVLDPDVVLRFDRGLIQDDTSREIRGAEAIANRAIEAGARDAQPALVDGSAGLVIAPRGNLSLVLRFTIVGGKIVEIEAIADPERLGKLDLALLAT